MGIGQIPDYGSLFQSYRIPEIPVAGYRRLSQSKEPAAENEQIDNSQNITPVVEKAVPERPGAADVDVKEISLSFNRGEDYGYIGRDSDRAALDMERAISDMKKDRVLQQYQYFVGGVKSLQNAGDDGSVVIKF